MEKDKRIKVNRDGKKENMSQEEGKGEMKGEEE